ncbi:MAG: AmmeMemoRadiSam system protein A [Phycisphaerae bacterium]
MSLTAQERAALVSLARAAVNAEIAGEAPPTPVGAEGVLAQELGCFVTLTNHGRLRGCIGTFQPQGPLGQMVVEMARAASRDGRFVYDPITPRELGELKVEVSVLSPLEQTDKPLELEVGRHGVFIVRGGAAGCFLPEVATDMGWNARQFLDECCAGKAGLPPNAWEMPGTKVYLFTSEKFDS